jgi:hypothetical protein
MTISDQLISDLRAKAIAHKAKGQELETMAARLEHHCRTGLWYFPHEQPTSGFYERTDDRLEKQRQSMRKAWKRRRRLEAVA